MTTSLPIAPIAPSLPNVPLPPGGSVAAGQAQDYLDMQGLEGLKTAAAGSPHDPATVRAVAQQFEALMIGMVMKSMREAKLGDGLMDSDQSRTYTDLLDQQLSLTLSQGRGLGIADMLVRSLLPPGAAAEAAQSPYSKGLRRGAAPAPTAGAAGTPTIGGTVGAGAVASTPGEFVSLVYPDAEAAGAVLGVDPVALVAQAAVESNWGRQIPSADGGSSYNLFGIKADSSWMGRRTVKDTVEYSAGVAERRREPFRAYDSMAHGFADYVDFLKTNPRYTQALQQGGDGEAFVAALHQAGYATDPGYSAKVTAVMRSPVLRAAVASLKKAPEPPIF